ncbi:hypothetical protein BJ742DRAFT_779613 [Cladochytrium replicatum]|nr:hypothetical protein BJ742DRAFT_779613 [Cladochytrium replicatum]
MPIPKLLGLKLVYYHAGVATEKDKKDKTTAFWEALSRSKIVRSLLGFIRHVGLAKASGLEQDELELLVRGAFKVYQQREDDEPATFKQRCDEFRAKHCWSTVALKFLGVFETVAMLDLPEYILANEEAAQGVLQATGNIQRNNFHDLRVTPAVEYTYHALAIDENRENFTPTLFEPAEPANPPKHLEQRWFRGSLQARIGGGEFQTCLSDTTLEWMTQKAKSAGLDVAPVSFVDTILAPFTLMGNDGGDGADDQTEALARSTFGRKVPRDISDYVDSGIYFPSAIDDSHPGAHKNVLQA